MPFLQDNRPLEIQTKLGKDVLGLRSMFVREEISRLFTIDVELTSEKPDIKFDDIVGHPVVIRVTRPDGELRYWHAQVARFQYVGESAPYFHYRAHLVPWLWALTRSADCRIFQEMKGTDIVEKVMKESGATDWNLNLSGTYEILEYCTQYRETHFSFVSRLLEQEGIAYYFKHDDKVCKMILADAKSGYEKPEGFESVEYLPNSGGSGLQSITSWVMEAEVQSTMYTLSDYNFLTPKTDLKSVAILDRSYGMAGKEVFDYPGIYKSVSEGERVAKVRIEEIQAASLVVRASTTCYGLGAGMLFKLKGHPRSDQNAEYLITQLNFSLDCGEFTASGETSENFSCDFVAIPSATVFRPSRVTPKPAIHGPQSAVVVGPSGEEIHTDEYGRVRLHFHWDRESAADEKSSSWVRVAQTWSGSKWGTFFLPRIGHDVLVEFLEGDPDRPVVTGSVYNKVNMPPYTLPDEKTISTIKSSSSKGGSGANEFRFEDKKGSEEVFLHAEKDLSQRVKNDSMELVGHDRHLTVKNDQIELVENDRHETVKGDHSEKIGKDRHVMVVGKEAKEVGATFSLVIKGDVTEVFKAKHSEEVTEDYYLKAKNIVIEAGTNITLKVGGSTIAIEEGGIGIKTNGDFKVEATGNCEIKSTAPMKLTSSATLDVKGSMATLKSDGPLTIQGAIVKIN